METLRELDDLREMVNNSIQQKEKDYIDLRLDYDQIQERLDHNEEILMEAKEKLAQYEEFDQELEVTKQKLTKKTKELEIIREKKEQAEMYSAALQEDFNEKERELLRNQQMLAEKEEELSQVREILLEKENRLAESEEKDQDAILVRSNQLEVKYNSLKEGVKVEIAQKNDLIKRLMEKERKDSEEIESLQLELMSGREENKTLRHELSSKNDKLKQTGTLLKGFKGKVAEHDSLSQDKARLEDLLQKSEEQRKLDEGKILILKENLNKKEHDMKKLKEDYLRNFEMLERRVRDLAQFKAQEKPPVAVTSLQDQVILKKIMKNPTISVKSSKDSSVQIRNLKTFTRNSSIQVSNIMGTRNTYKNLPPGPPTKPSLPIYSRPSSASTKEDWSTSSSTLEELLPPGPVV